MLLLEKNGGFLYTPLMSKDSRDRNDTITRFAAQARKKGKHTYLVPSPPFEEMRRTITVSPRETKAAGKRHTLIMHDSDPEVGSLGETVLEDYRRRGHRNWRTPVWFNNLLRQQEEDERREIEAWERSRL